MKRSDFGDWKPHAEVLLAGTCHPPGGRATECAVRFSVGEKVECHFMLNEVRYVFRTKVSSLNCTVTNRTWLAYNSQALLQRLSMNSSNGLPFWPGPRA